MYTFPSSDLDKPAALLSLLGGHWSETYAGAKTVQDVAQAVAGTLEQAFVTFEEARRCLAIATTPIAETRCAFKIELKRSDLNASLSALPRYNDPDAPGHYDSSLKYDTPREKSYTAFPIPAELRSVPILCDTPVRQSVVLTAGVDYYLDVPRGTIFFLKSPFDDERLKSETVFDDDGQSDEVITLWGLDAQVRKDYLFEQHGYVLLPSRFESSPAMRDLFDAVYRARIRGTTAEDVARLFAAVTGVSLARSDEAVEFVDYLDAGLTIVTDKHAYLYSDMATPLVSVGDSVRCGDPLVDSLRIYELNRGSVSSEVPGIPLPKRLIRPGLVKDDLFFPNAVSATSIAHANGAPEIRFTVHGAEEDVEVFWEAVHQAGVADGKLLSNYLDIRANPDTQPGPESLPQTINPCQFLTRHLLRGTAILVRIKASGFNTHGAGLSWLQMYREIEPPGTTIIVEVEIDSEVLEASITAEVAGSTSHDVEDPVLVASTSTIMIGGEVEYSPSCA